MSFTGEFNDQGIIKDYEERTGAKVEFQLIPIDQYEAKIRPLLATGRNVPDLFVGEAAYVRQFVEAGYWENLSAAPFNADVSNMFSYAAEMGTDANGNVVALTWQTTPGGWFYRRSIAKEYFGTDDPAEVAKLFVDWETALETAETLKRESGGKIHMFPGIGETIFRIFYSARTRPWVNANNEFVIDRQILDYFRLAKQIRDSGYDAKLADWTGPFMEAMNTSPDEANVFVYGWPTWGLHFVLAGQEQSKGDWAVVSGPAPFFWGGTWLGIYKDSKNKDLAWAFISMLTQDEEYMKTYARRAGEFVSNKKVVEEIKDEFASETLSGQNHFEFFLQETSTIDGSTIAGYDYQVNQILSQVVNEHLEGALTYDGAVEAMKSRVKEAFPQLTVD